MNTHLFQGAYMLQEARELLNSWEYQKDINGALILSCDKNNINKQQYEQLIPENLPVFGGIFPQIIYGDRNYDEGVLLIGLPDKPRITTLKNISQPNEFFEEHMDDALLDEDYQTMFVFVDAFSTRIGDFVEGLFNAYGLEMNFIGGGAGSLSMAQKPCILTNEGLLEDAAVLAALKNPSSIGVKHGWEELGGPFKVTSSEKNTIYMLENKPAYETYKEIIEKDSGKTLNSSNFFDVAKAYPFGISKIGTEKVVRDPVMMGSSGELICVGEVPQNTFVHILKGETDNLVKAAGKAKAQALSKDDAPEGDIFFIDCISRVLFLENNFQKEIETVKGKASSMAGALTLGEIANSGNEYLEFFNKTAVVALIKNL